MEMNTSERTRTELHRLLDETLERGQAFLIIAPDTPGSYLAGVTGVSLAPDGEIKKVTVDTYEDGEEGKLHILYTPDGNTETTFIPAY